MPVGRKAHLAVDTTPGRILALALVANAPVLLGFVLAPLVRGPEAARAFVPFVLFGTPLVAAGGLWSWWRAPPERRAHRASRIGLLLLGVAFLMWALVALPTLWRRLA